nr:MAG TPA: hypothetical protein [Caudoviricetes sp.]
MIFQRNGSPDLHWKVYDERSLLKQYYNYRELYS